MAEPKFATGAAVYVRDPKRYSAGCTCIVGTIDAIVTLGSSFKYEFEAEICRPGGSKRKRVSIHEIDLDHQVGTPISELSSQRFAEIGTSWGYP